MDNNSQDSSVEYLSPLFPDVNFIALKENIGFGRANNLGIEAAKGEFLLILNPDTVLEEKTLRTMLDFMRANPKTGISGCKVLNPDGSFQLACRRGFPTPWASFCKLFGLQRLFPKSKLFARYNQTFRSIDETYNIDSVIGAFMFCRSDAVRAVNGFDPEFFMYGEDLDLCFRVKQMGWDITYLHTTSIIHFKGESTKRSSINEVKHFYKAMEIFARKHYGGSNFFLAFLRTGIFLRSIIAYFIKYKSIFSLILFDLAAVNFSLLLATKIRFGEYFNFPDYAYPIVFIVISVVLFISMTGAGEYFEHKPTIRKSIFGLMISFFVLSSLTYFFKEYAFSRGILLMTIGFTSLLTSASRFAIALFDKIAGSEADRRIAIVGVNESTKSILNEMSSTGSPNLLISGVIGTDDPAKYGITYPLLGSVEFLPKIIAEYKIQEVIINDKEFVKSKLMNLASELSSAGVKLHVADEFDELIASKIIGDITGATSTLPEYKIFKWRLAFVKRTFDICLSLFLLSIGLPLVYLLSDEPKKIINNIFNVLTGNKTFIGIYPVNGEMPKWKEGLIGLAHIGSPERLSDKAVENLNDYYMKNYSFSLDIDIFLKFITREKSGKTNP